MNKYKYEEYKLYREQQIKEGKKPLSYIDYLNWRMVARKNQEARVKNV